MSRLSFLVIACCVLSVLAGGHLALAAPTSKIEGVAKDAQTGDVLPGANVAIVGTSLGASTDIYGHYTIRNVSAGAYQLRATYVGYETVTKPIQVIEGVDAKQDFALTAVGVIGETVVVTAQAMGQTEAINQQLSSQSIVNVVSSARIQELPDANAAESVGRLPGVSILRSGGEGNQIVIRGLQPKYNAVMVDGVRMASSNPNDRSVDLSMISPNMLEGIEVTKAVTPDQDADVIGGTVNFKMREAKGGAEGLGYNFLAQAGYNGLADAHNKYNNYKYVGSVDGRFFDQLFGVFVQADFERRNLTSNEFGGNYNHLGSSTVLLKTDGMNLNYIPRDRTRKNGTVVLDYVLPEGKISFNNFFSNGFTGTQNRSESFDVNANLHTYTMAGSGSTLNTITNALNLEQQVMMFHVNAKLSHTYSETKNPEDWSFGFQQGSAGIGQFSGQAGINPQSIPAAATNSLTTTYLGPVQTMSSRTNERAYTAALDIDVPLDITDGMTSVIKFGGKYRYQTREYNYEQYSGQGLGLGSAKYIDSTICANFPTAAAYINSTTIPMTAFMDADFSYGKFLGGDFPMSAALSYGMLARLAELFRAKSSLFSTYDGISYNRNALASTIDNYTGNEKLSAFYLMGTFNIGQEITVIPGARYQSLKTAYTAARGVETTGSINSYHHIDTTITETHGYWLPDVMVRYKPLNWFDVRLSYSNTLAYPDYNSIVPKIGVSSAGTISWNNATLKPSRSTNYDAYLSFYDNTIGLFTVGGYYKEITDLIYPWTFYVSNHGWIPYYPPNYPNVDTTSNLSYVVNSFVNDPYKVKVYGVEFDWQTHFWYLPHPFDGLVMNVNYTHVTSKAEYPYVDKRSGRGGAYFDTTFSDRLLFQPNDIINLSLGYDYRGFSIRVSLLYQADIFTGPQYWPQLRTSTPAYRRWDMSVKQELPVPGLQLFADLNNINSANDISLVHGTGFPQSESSYGMTGDIGLRYHF